MKRPTVMLLGLGDLGSVVLELLARDEQIGRIVVASRNGPRGMARCNLVRLGAVAQGYSPSIGFRPLDIKEKEAVIEIVRREAPDILLTTATMQTWWLPDLLPPGQTARIKGAGFGIWLPVHLALTLKLMQALRDIAYQGITLTAPFPDVVNCILGRLQLAPTCGVGNLDEIVPKVQILAAERLEVPVEEVRVFLVAHHALQPVAFGESLEKIPPYFLRIEHAGQDVTEHVRAGELLLDSYPIPPGPVIHFLTAGCTLRLIKAFLSEREVLVHVPGPKGLPGGYPVTVSRKGLKLVPIEGLTREEAIAINERSHRFDGIERIEADGTVVFCPESVDVISAELNYECERLSPEEAEERAKELISRFREYARRHGVSLEAPGGVPYVLRNP